MVRRVFWLVVGFVLLASRPARADRVHGAVGPATELSHRVTVTLHRGYAEWDAERELSSQGAGQAILSLELPLSGDDTETLRAVPVGLRLRDGRAWRRGVLAESETASAQFFDGGGEDATAALLSAGFSANEATLRVSGMHPGVRREVGYRLLVPMRYERGHYRLVLPAMSGDERSAPPDPNGGMAPIIVPTAVGGALVVNGQPWPDGEPIQLDPRRGLELSLRPPASGWTLDGTLVVIPFGKRFLTHAHVEVVPELSQRPRGAQVVLVIDRSRSMEDELLDGARAAARAYLAHLPDAEVEVVTFAREATRRYGRFVSAAAAGRDLESWRPTKDNGSELGPALALAEDILAERPTGRPRRVVVLTDGRMRHDLEVRTLADSLSDARESLLQVVRVQPTHGSDRPALGRDDDSAWMTVAASTGGLAWMGRFPTAVEPKPSLVPTVERLVRPTMLSHFEATSAPFLDTAALLAPTELGEGEGVSFTELLDEPLPWLTVKGKRWHDAVSFTLPVHDAEAPVWAALAFGSDRLALEDDAIARLQLARRGGAVTDATSYVVGRTVEPPPAERMGFASFGSRHGFSTRCGGRGIAVTFEGRRWLENQLRHALYACGAEQHRVTVKLETIGRELAQVDGVEVSEGAPATLSSCMTRAAWSLDLPEEDFAGRPSRQWEVAVRAIMP